MRSKRTRAKTIIDLRRFFIFVLRNRRCGADIKINTTSRQKLLVFASSFFILLIFKCLYFEF